MGHRYSITTEGEEGLGAASAETLLFVAGSTTRKAAIIAFGIAFDGTSSTAEPVQWKLKRGNSASQGTFTGATEEKHDPDDPSASCTGFHSSAGEPTYTGQPLRHGEVHPQGGIYGEVKEVGFWELDDSANSFLGIEVTAPATVNAAAWMEWEE